jgi:hypothetical protein
VTVDFPSEFTKQDTTFTATKLSGTDNCYIGTVSGVTNPPEFTSTGTFALWTSREGGQLKRVNWGFGALGFGPERNTMSSTNVRFVTGLVDGIEDSSTK